MYGDELTRVYLGHDEGVVTARQRTRDIAELLGFDRLEQTRVATAVSELARNARRYAGGGEVRIRCGPSALQIEVIDEGPGIPDGEASRVFEAVGIRLVWVSGSMPQAPRYLVIRVVSKPMSRMSRNPGVLGTAASSNGNGATIATLYYGRIASQCGRFGVDAPLLLGHVMAHEMGHLLLPAGGHTAAGLMKAGWDMHQSVLASAGKLTFAPNQASLIRAHLQRARESLIPNP